MAVGTIITIGYLLIALTTKVDLAASLPSHACRRAASDSALPQPFINPVVGDMHVYSLFMQVCLRLCRRCCY